MGQRAGDGFVKLKKELADSSMLAYFDKDAPTRVIADASPVGLGAVLVQEMKGQNHRHALSAGFYGCSPTITRCVTYVPSRKNIADILSRLTKIPASKGYVHDDEYVCMITLQAVPVALRIQEIEEASARDVELQVVHECLHIGNWERAPKAYMMARNELASIGHVGLRGTRIVIPRELQQRVLELAHEGHQGIVKTKERLRSKVWWSGLDKQAEKKCKHCYGCQLTTKHVPPHQSSQQLCQKKHGTGFTGPLPPGGGDGGECGPLNHKCHVDKVLGQPLRPVWRTCGLEDG